MPAITSLPFVGSAWGNYWLESSLPYNNSYGAAIYLPHYSSLDFRGNWIYGPGDPSGYNIGLVTADQESVVVFGNGGIAQFTYGIHGFGPGGGTTGLRIRDTTLKTCWFRGLDLNARGFDLHNVTADGIGGGTHVYTLGHSFGFELRGTGVVRDCVARNIWNPVAEREKVGFGVYDNATPIVFRGNVAHNATQDANSIGFWFGSAASRVVAQDNTAVNQAIGFWWSEQGTAGSFRDNHTDNCGQKYRFNPALVTDAGGNT